MEAAPGQAGQRPVRLPGRRGRRGVDARLYRAGPGQAGAAREGQTPQPLQGLVHQLAGGGPGRPGPRSAGARSIYRVAMKLNTAQKTALDQDNRQFNTTVYTGGFSAFVQEKLL